MDITVLPEDQRKEGEGLIEAIAEERKEKEEFLKRKKELKAKINSQEKDISQLQEEVSSLEAKVE